MPSVTGSVTTASHDGTPATGTLVVSSQTNQVMYVCSLADSTVDASPSATSDLDTLTSIGTVTSGANAQGLNLLRKINPTVGTHNLSASASAGPGTMIFLIAFCVINANQATPEADIATNSGTVAALSITVANVISSDLVIDIGLVNGNPVVTVGANQTSLANFNGGGAGGAMGVASSQAGTDGGAMTWSWSGNQRSAHIALRVLTDSGGGASTWGAQLSHEHNRIVGGP
jgi:hypothetical protein